MLVQDAPIKTEGEISALEKEYTDAVAALMQSLGALKVVREMYRENYEDDDWATAYLIVHSEYTSALNRYDAVGGAYHTLIDSGQVKVNQ